MNFYRQTGNNVRVGCPPTTPDASPDGHVLGVQRYLTRVGRPPTGWGTGCVRHAIINPHGLRNGAFVLNLGGCGRRHYQLPSTPENERERLILVVVGFLWPMPPL